MTRTDNSEFFPRVRQADVPKDRLPPHREGRILVEGRILTDGFELRPVESPIALLGDDGKETHPTLGTTAIADVAMMLRAVRAAAAAWDRGTGLWPTARLEDRVAAVQRFRDGMVARRDEVCRLLMWEICKTWDDALGEFDRTVAYIDDTLEATRQLDRDAASLQFVGGLMAQVRRMPLGVTLCMGPFNYPLNETFTTLIPALVMGNTTVVKLPRFGRLLWDPLLEVFRECFPPGVVNLLNGDGKTVVGEAMRSGLVDVLAFIGSSGVANTIKVLHPKPHRLRSVLGLDAKNPAIILPDARLDVAVSECIKGALSFNGQRCTAIKLVHVHETIAEAFVERLSRAVDALGVGLPWEKGTSITPLPDPNKPAQLTELIEDAVSRGARVKNARGGATRRRWFAPTVVAGVTPAMRLSEVEQFGPIVPVMTFRDTETVLERIVESSYGMQASLFTDDPRVAGRVIDALSNQVCRINLNSQCQRGPDVFPFTGRKDSAEGTLSVTDALRAFSIRSMVATKQDTAGKALVKGILDGDTSRFLSTNIML